MNWDIAAGTKLVNRVYSEKNKGGGGGG